TQLTNIGNGAFALHRVNRREWRDGPATSKIKNCCRGRKLCCAASVYPALPISDLNFSSGKRNSFGGPSGESGLKSIITTRPPGLIDLASLRKYASRSPIW